MMEESVMTTRGYEILLLSTPCHDHSHLCETQDCQTQLHTYQTHVGMVTYLPTLPNTAPYHIHSVAICVCVCVWTYAHTYVYMYICRYTAIYMPTYVDREYTYGKPT